MILEWLYRTSIETTALIALVLLLRPIVRKILGAKVSYWLWILPLIRVFLLDRPQRDGTVLEAIGIPIEKLQTEFLPTPALTEIPMNFPWEAVWLVGIALWIGIRLSTWYRFRKTLLAQSCSFAASQTLADRISAKIHGSLNDICFYSCRSPSAPFVTGLLKPTIFLPRDFERRFSAEEQAWVIVHELTHVQRKDLWIQFIGEMLRAVFWFNPFVHFAVQVVQEDQELACDHSILSRCVDEDRYHYGKALLAGVGPQLIPSVMTFFSKNKARFTMLSKHKVSTLNSVLGISLCVLISVFALTKVPLSMASSDLVSEERISMRFQKIKLSSAMKLVSDFSDFSISNLDIVPDHIAIFARIDNVPANTVFYQLMDCGGLEVVEYESGIELRIKQDVGKGIENWCIVTNDGHSLLEAGEVVFLDAMGKFKATGGKVTLFK